PAATRGGVLRCALCCMHGGCVPAYWRLPLATLRPGWLPLRMPAALDRPYRMLELRLRCIGSEAESLRLSVAATGLRDEFAMKVESGSEVGSLSGAAPSGMLAIRIWAGLPGTPWDSSRSAGGHPLWGELAVSVLDPL